MVINTRRTTVWVKRRGGCSPVFRVRFTGFPRFITIIVRVTGILITNLIFVFNLTSKVLSTSSDLPHIEINRSDPNMIIKSRKLRTPREPLRTPWASLDRRFDFQLMIYWHARLKTRLYRVLWNCLKFSWGWCFRVFMSSCCYREPCSKALLYNFEVRFNCVRSAQEVDISFCMSFPFLLSIRLLIIIEGPLSSYFHFR